MLELMKKFPDDQRSGFHAVQYIGSRIKSPESMMEKLKRKALPETLEAALCEVHDAVGVRVICSFADDVFRVIQCRFDKCSMIQNLTPQFING